MDDEAAKYSLSGKVLNRIWETRFITGLAEAYDMIWDHIDLSFSLQGKIGKSGEEIRSFIEANLLEDALEAIEQEDSWKFRDASGCIGNLAPCKTVCWKG